MGGYAVAVGRCIGCGRTFAFNPLRVPSVKGEPVCPTCMEWVNKARRENGLPEFGVPADAYGPCEEAKLAS